MTTERRAPGGTLDGKSALVMAASRGIGRATALALGRAGARVAVNYRSNAEAAEQVAGEIDGSFALQGDALDPDGVRALFAEADRRLDGLDIYVHTVGSPAYVPVVEVDDEAFEQSFARVTRSGFVALQEAARRLRDGGRIIVISSGAAVRPTPTAGLYGAAKTALDYMGAVLARELGPRGVTVNSVAPGVTETDGLIMSRDQIDAMVAQTPLGRLGQPADVADVVALVASPAAGWMTGQWIGAAGGLV